MPARHQSRHRPPAAARACAQGDRFADRRAALGDELDLKTKLFEYAGDTETVFATGDYLRRKAQILLGDEMEDTAAKGRARKTKPTKAPKEPKVPTAKISYDMFI